MHVPPSYLDNHNDDDCVNVVVTQFLALLNTKKRKIWEQQTMLDEGQLTLHGSPVMRRKRVRHGACTALLMAGLLSQFLGLGGGGGG